MADAVEEVNVGYSHSPIVLSAAPVGAKVAAGQHFPAATRIAG
jgi:hypothetical protein